MKFPVKVILAVFVFGAVGLNILSAIAMKLLANQAGINTWLLLLGIGGIVFLNGLRLLVWMFANKRFPLSTMYPLTSIFYPMMLGVSYYFGEKISPFQIIGTILIALGVFWLGWKLKDDVA